MSTEARYESKQHTLSKNNGCLDNAEENISELEATTKEKWEGGLVWVKVLFPISSFQKLSLSPRFKGLIWFNAPMDCSIMRSV